MTQAHETFTCQACGHRFAGLRNVVSRQPTCPECRTYGKLVGEDNRPVGTRRNANPVKRPVAPSAGRGAPAGQGRGADDFVEVRADVAYGRGTNPRAVVNLVLLLVLGIGIVGTFYFIVTTLKEDRTERIREEKEIVLDEAAFEEAVNKAVGDAGLALNRVEGVEVFEGGDVSEVLQSIRGAGGHNPMWREPPRPGQPFRAHSYVVKHQYNGVQVKGFVVLLYYRTAEEVAAAESELHSQISREMTHYGVQVNPSMWYVAYMGVSHGGPLRDALKQAMNSGAPSSFKQFTDRMGATGQN